MLEVKPILQKHIERYCKDQNVDKSSHQISNDISCFINKCLIPTVLTRFGDFVSFLRLTKAKNPTIFDKMLKLLEIEVYISDALDYEFNFDDKKQEYQFFRTSTPRGWHEAFPLYMTLISAKFYKFTDEFVYLFYQLLMNYYNKKELLSDSMYATEEHSREYIVLSNFRLQFTDNEFNAVDIFSGIYTEDTGPYILRLQELIVQKMVSGKQRKYSQSLLHLFKSDFQPSDERTRLSGKGGGGRRTKNTKNLVPDLNSDIFAMTPLKTRETEDGLVESDEGPVVEYAVINSDFEQKRSLKTNSSAEAIFDKTKKAHQRIDLTDYAKRNNNAGRQSQQTLQPIHLINLFKYLEKRKLKLSHRVNVIVLWIMLLLGKSIDDVFELNLWRETKPLTDGLFIDEQGEGWWYFKVKASSLYFSNDSLVSTKDDVYTPCPKFLVDLILFLNEDRNENYAKIIPIEKKNEKQEIVSTLEKRLKRFSDQFGAVRLNLTNISNFIGNYLKSSQVIDPVIFDFSYRLALYKCRVSRSYTQITEEQRQSELTRFWKKVISEVNLQDPKFKPETVYKKAYYVDKEVAYGSRFVPKTTVIKSIAEDLRTKVVSCSSRFYKLSDIIEYHNHFVIYMAWMLMFGSAYRARSNPFPSFLLSVSDLNMMIISDKDNEDLEHTRIVAIPSQLSLQLLEYKSHLRKLKGLLRVIDPKSAAMIDRIADDIGRPIDSNDELASWARKNKKNSPAIGPLFLINQKSKKLILEPVSPKFLKRALPLQFNIPVNAGRHYMRTFLLANTEDIENIDFQMGHYHSGENPLSKHSSVSLLDRINELLPLLDEMLEEMGWSLIKSAFS